ncbi:Hypothetical predicted protein [Podarcis lilfordi]|uniref:Uncharacterized protein n=1 Tax=Podarcis lilfordi TaxID=74358 RepID=A0AA35KSL1_9SAUR|nr:Hypothetical predicted protein [Podarcis lilfordi]
MESPRVLEPFQPSEPDTWEDYVERFEFFAEAQGITDASKRRATFLSYCGPETFKLAKALLAPAKLSETSLKDILACLTSHLAPTDTKMARRMEFHKRQQHAGESVSAFLAELRKLAQHCDFQNLEETLLDRFIGGLSSKKARRRIVAKEEVTLASALKEATATENYEREELDASRKAPKPQIEVAHAMDELEATPSQSPVRGVESDCHYVTEINGRVVQFPAQGKAHVKVKIEGQQCDMEVDSGSGFTIVSDQTARTFFPRGKLPPLEPFPATLQSYSAGRIHVMGMCAHATPCTATGKSPAELLLGRRLVTVLDYVHPDKMPNHNSRATPQAETDTTRYLAPEDLVWVRNYSRGSRWVAGVVTRASGPVSYYVTLENGQVWKRHIDQLRRRALSREEPDNSSQANDAEPQDQSENGPEVQSPGALTNEPGSASPHDDEVQIGDPEMSGTPSVPDETPRAAPLPQVTPNPEPATPVVRRSSRSCRPPQYLRDYVCCAH